MPWWKDSDIISRIRVNKSELDLTNFGLFNDNLAKIIPIINDYKVKNLTLNCNNLDDDASKMIATCRQLESLDLSYNNFSDDCIWDILALPALRFLDLSRTMVSDAGANIILELLPPELENVVLIRTKVTEDLRKYLHHVLSERHAQKFQAEQEQNTHCTSTCLRL